jgi:hypothetical protein
VPGMGGLPHESASPWPAACLELPQAGAMSGDDTGTSFHDYAAYAVFVAETISSTFAASTRLR